MSYPSDEDAALCATAASNSSRLGVVQMNKLVAPLTLLCLGVFSSAALAQAPSPHPSAEEVWAYPTGSRIYKPEAHELWGDVYCSGGTIGRPRGHCCTPLLSRLTSCFGAAFDAVIPCHSYGCGCKTVKPVRPKRSCHRCRIPSVRFGVTRCGCHSGGIKGSVIYDGPALAEPPQPQAEQAPAPSGDAANSRYYQRRANPLPSRPASSRLIRSSQTTQRSTARRVSYEEPIKVQADSSTSRKRPKNPLR